MKIMLLCKVVDNYGDIGFVYRLARQLSVLDKTLELSLVVSNLDSFSQMENRVNPKLSFQQLENWKIFDWNDSDFCKNYFLKDKPYVILECFQCGRPDWLEEIIFDEQNTDIFHIVNVEYLTAEEWADDFHLLKSGTRSSFVKKVNFMGGFTNKTAGLILNDDFIKSINDKNFALESLKSDLDEEILQNLMNPNIFSVLIFTYQRSFDNFVSQLNKFRDEKRKTNKDFNIQILAANSLSLPFVKEALEKQISLKNDNFIFTELPYLNQLKWDKLLTLTDFNVIRGEDSFSRVCLSGIPWLWHAYIQDDEYQIVKVEAILKRLEPFFDQSDFQNLRNVFLDFNRNRERQTCPEVDEVLETFESENVRLNELLRHYESLKSSYQKFSKDLIEKGDLAQNLLNYLKQLKD